jgi:hypothetical protein
MVSIPAEAFVVAKIKDFAPSGTLNLFNGMLD